MAVDIEHFKIFNEWYGQEAGDRFLKIAGGFFKRTQESNKGIAGYMGDDDLLSYCLMTGKRLKVYRMRS